MELNFQSVFLVLGFVQGLVLVIVAFFHKVMNQFPHKLFGLILLVLTLGTLGTFANHELEYFSHPIGLRLLVNYFPYYLILILGPAMYFHCKGVILRDFKFKKKDLIHFYPIVFEFVPLMVSVFIWISWLLNTSKNTPDGYVSFLWHYQRGMEIPRAISIIVYTMLGWHFLRSHKKDASKQRYKWVKTLLLFSSGLICLFLIDLSIYFSPARSVVFEYPFDIYTIYYPICAFIYFVSFRLLFQKPPWFWSNYEVLEVENKASQILKFIKEEKAFQNADLKLSDVSKTTGIPEKIISFVLNHHFQKGFNEFINELRVKEVLKRMDQEDLNKFTIEGIATSVGFASRATFYRAFKKCTNKLPSDYLA